MRKSLFLLTLLPLLALAQTNDSFLLNVSEITVKQGHDAQFVEGVKAYVKCYNDNNGTEKWNIWRRVQGKGPVYAFTSTMANWAEMDTNDDAAGKACRTQVINLIIPHVKSFEYNIARSIPELSRTTPMPENTALVWVYNVKTSNSDSFRESVKEVVGALKKAEGDSRGVWYNVQGGSPEMADYFVAIPYDNFAAMDADRDGVWDVYEKANGKAKTDALKAKFRASVSKDWSYMWTLNKELSNQ